MTEEEMKEKRREYARKFRESHPGYQTKYMRRYREKHREEFNRRCREYQRRRKEKQQQWMNDYHETKEGRATNLLNSYIQMDVERGRGKPELTREDIMRKCFSDDSKCVYCGETDWHKLGLDRIDNNEAHHAWNTFCSCHDCNVARYRRSVGDYLEALGIPWDQFMKQNGFRYLPDHIVLKRPED